MPTNNVEPSPFIVQSLALTLEERTLIELRAGGRLYTTLRRVTRLNVRKVSELFNVVRDYAEIGKYLTGK
jgi:hypothetical protein